MATDIFARIGDIKGESLDARHKDEIEIQSFSWGVMNNGAIGGTGGTSSGKPTFQDLALVHRIDKASPALFRACATGQRFKDAAITHRKAGGAQAEYLVIKLNDVLVTSVAHSGDGQSNTETISVGFGKVDFEYRTQKPDGSPGAASSFKYDLKTGKVF